jgi:light-regulated signal transduction histidine kinase (bacteriophytochrome)
MYFNSKQYAWSNVQAVMLGRIVTGLRGVEYKTSREKEPVYGAGDEPQGIQFGNKKYEGTITILQSELEALARFAKTNGFDDITDVEFDLVVAYVPQTGAPIVTDTIKFVSITEIPKAMKQNDKFMEVALPFIALGVKYSG